MTQFHGDQSKINACAFKEKQKNAIYWEFLKASIDNELKEQESCLSSRLSDEILRGIFDIQRATIGGTPIDQIEKALVSQRKIRRNYNL